LPTQIAYSPRSRNLWPLREYILLKEKTVKTEKSCLIEFHTPSIFEHSPSIAPRARAFSVDHDAHPSPRCFCMTKNDLKSLKHKKKKKKMREISLRRGLHHQYEEASWPQQPGAKSFSVPKLKLVEYHKIIQMGKARLTLGLKLLLHNRLASAT
jgi:hypothetical protein